MTDPAGIVLLGFGSVNKTVCKILLEKKDAFKRLLGRALVVKGVSDSSGGVYNTAGLDLELLLTAKQGTPNKRGSVTQYPGSATLTDGSESLVAALLADETAGDMVLFDGAPTDLKTGGVALKCVRAFLEKGRDVVLANKGPVAVAYKELHETAARTKARLRFSATVCGGLPALNAGTRDLAGATISDVSGIFNSTSNMVLSMMAEGTSQADAVDEARRLGMLEADPTSDLGGWDAAAKLCIVANSVLGLDVKVGDLKVAGVQGISAEDIQQAAKEGEVYKLIARAQRGSDGKYTLSVGPERHSTASFLGQCSGRDMCIVFKSDIFETIQLQNKGEVVRPTAGAMLRDLVDLTGVEVSHRTQL